MNQSVNRFVKGIVSDYNPLDIDNQSWVFPTMNVRITKKGDLLVAKPLDGNTELFTIPEGNKVIGAKEYANVLYLVFYKPQFGFVEVGSYPHVPIDGENFVYEYGELKFVNYDGNLNNGGNPIGGDHLFGPKLGYDGTNDVDLLFSNSYDGTVDIYLNDGVNPTYVINNCFTSEGKYVNRQVNYTSLPENIRLINSSSKPASIDNLEVSEGGSLRPGNHEYFIKYVNKSFDSTVYLAQSEIISIFEGENNSKLGKFKSISGIKQEVNKKIKLELSNLDTNYDYFQIAVVISSSNADEISQKETFLISKYFSTAEDSVVVITGSEPVETLSLDEVAAIVSVDNVNKSHTIINSRYIGANWESSDYDRESLKELANKLSLSPKEFEITEENKNMPGLMPREIYPYGVVFVLEGGRETDVFPVETAKVPYWTDKGLLFVDGINDNKFNHHYGVTLNLSAFNIAVENNSSVKGFYLVRGERIKNTISSGVRMPTIDKANGYFYNQIKTAESGYNLPWFGIGVSSGKFRYPTYSRNDESTKMDITHTESINSNPEYWGLYSPEALFKHPDVVSLDSQQLYVVEQNLTERASTETKPNSYYQEGVGVFNEMNRMSAICGDIELDGEKTPLKRYASFINKGTKRGIGGFTSFISDAFRDERPIYNEWNDGWITHELRSTLSPNYIGLKRGDIGDESMLGYSKLVKYKSEDDYFEQAMNNFLVRNTFYQKIGNFIPVEDAPSSYELLEGDTYTGDLYIRTHRWFGAYKTKETENLANGIYQHGYYVKFPVRSVVNIHARSNQRVDNSNDELLTGDYSFLPYKLGELREWVFKSSSEKDVHESTKLNWGYSDNQSIKQYAGYDDISPDKTNNYITRLRHSDKRTSGAYYNAFKVFRANHYKDYDEQYGPIIDIFNLKGKLISVQHDAINMHYTSESIDGEFDIALGSTQDYLYEKSYMKASYGAQKRDHLLQTDEYIYGVDVKNFKIYRIITGASPEGRQLVQVENLNESKKNDSYITTFLSSIKDYIKDVYLGYDQENKEILFTFWHDSAKFNEVDGTVNNNATGIAGPQGSKKVTIVYSELINAFTGLYNMPINYYATYNNHLVSFKNEQAYIHDNNGEQLNICGVDYNMILSYIVNSSGEEVSPLVKKFFQSMKLRSSNAKLVNIKFKTDSQSGELNPFYDEERFWLQPEYNEYHWEIPIPVNKNGQGQFDEDSVMKGEWLKVTLEYEGKEEFYVVYATALFNPINY